MSYTAERLKEDVRMAADLPAVRLARGGDREGAVTSLRSLGSYANQLASQLERGDLSEATLESIWEHLDQATRMMVEVTRAAFHAQRR